jgi:hypothetical protein
MPARTFAEKMWPGRHGEPGRAKIAGNTVLHRLGKLGYVEKAGDLWFLRGFSNPSSGGLGTELGAGLGSGLGTQFPAGLPAGFPTQLPTVSTAALPAGSTTASPDDQAERLRLGQLVALADNPVAGVTHDVALGNVRIRGRFIDDCLAEACAFAVLRGRSINTYPPVDQMVVGLTPAEGARALYLKWRQSGLPPEPPFRGGVLWINVEDGIASAPNCWQPEGADRYWTEEPTLQRIARQRAEAGLGPAR